MVRAGLAWAFVRYSTAYVADEQAARAARRGIWQGETAPPWEWRARQRLDQGIMAPTAPLPVTATPARGTGAGEVGAAPAEGCNIKGSVGRSGRIYHTPESPWYERVRMSLGMGRRWFCSEQEAQAAGWRPTVSAR
jgi:hypothetical protein